MLNRRATPAVAGSFFIGALLGALTTTAVLVLIAGLLSPISLPVRAGIALAAVAVLALRAIGVLSFPLPQNARQIPEHAFSAAATTAAFRFAYELGTAARTYITKDAAYCVGVIFALLSPRGLGPALLAAILLAAGFAAGRSLIVVGQTWRTRAITAHPRWSLRGADLGTILVCGIYAVAALSG